MTPYKNLDGDSGIESYEISDNSIVIRFNKGAVRNYLYTNQKPGAAMVERMKLLAVQGRGLNSYISTTVRSQYEDKW